MTSPCRFIARVMSVSAIGLQRQTKVPSPLSAPVQVVLLPQTVGSFEQRSFGGFSHRFCSGSTDPTSAPLKLQLAFAQSTDTFVTS